MRIDDYEFEEEKTLQNLANLLSNLADEIRDGKKIELPMPSMKENLVEIPLGEPVETGIEINFRKSYVHLTLNLSWKIPETEIRSEQDE